MSVGGLTNWRVQGTGLGFEIVAGAATVVFPNQRWIAVAFFSVGTLLLLLPALLWSFGTIGQRLGVRNPIDLKSPWRSAVTGRQLFGAVSALLAMVVFGVLVTVKVLEVRAQTERERQRLVQRNTDIAFFVSGLEKQLVIGDQLEGQAVTSDQELYEWLLAIGRWQGKTFYTYEQAVRLSVLTEVEKREFDKVAAPGLSSSFNAAHSGQRGWMIARLAVMRSHTKKLRSELEGSPGPIGKEQKS